MGLARPLVTVITPVLNSADTLEATLSSVAAQRYPNIEHVVIDGGSRDGTIDVLRRFQSAVPLRWLSEPDTGMYVAINKGIRLAQGEVLAYLNGDDLYLPWSVERAVSALTSSTADLAFGDLLVLLKQDGHARWLRIQLYPRFRPRIYAYEVNMGQPTVFWRRRVTDTIGGFDERLDYCGDFEFWLRAGTAGFRYTHLREVLAVAVEHERALATVHADEVRRELEQVRKRYADTVRARKFAWLRSLTQSLHWRWQVLMLMSNLGRDQPSSWVELIHFVKRADLDLDGDGILPLLLPMPLPKSWRMWRLDAAEFEKKLAEEFRRRRSAV